MARCAHYEPGKSADGQDIQVRCTGQVPNSTGQHKCIVCGTINVVDFTPGHGRPWDGSKNKGRPTKDRRRK